MVVPNWPIAFKAALLVPLIRDLADPFDHASKGATEDVSLKPLDQALARIDNELARFDGIQGGTNA